MNRGDLVLVRTKGDDAGRPRPAAVVVQSDLCNPSHRSVTVCPITSRVVSAPLFRPALEPTEANGLRRRSQVMVDKISSARRQHVGPTIGILDTEILLGIDEALRSWLQL